MNYHDTVPTEMGDYWSPKYACYLWRTSVGWVQVGRGKLTDEEVGTRLPLIRLPSTNHSALSLACDVAFARMWMLSDNQSNLHRWNIMKLYGRFSTGERSLSLLRDMEQVTGKLGAKDDH